MICCKITTNFNTREGDFSSVCNKLAQRGDVKWANNSMYYCSLDTKINVKTIKNILKTCGYRECYILEYSKDNVPQEDDDTNKWLADHLVKLNYKQYEEANQAVLKDLNSKIEALRNELKTN